MITRILNFSAKLYLLSAAIILPLLTLKVLDLKVETIITTIPAVMSAVAAYFSYIVASKALKHGQLRDRCYLSINSQLNPDENDNLLQISVINNGPGLAIFKSGKFKLGDISADISSIEQLDKLIEHLEFNTSTESIWASAIGKDVAISANQKIPLIVIPNKLGDSDPKQDAQTKKVDEILQHIRVEIEYTDIHGELGNTKINSTK